MSSERRLHTFVLYVEDRPGVLNRIASLFRRRAYNIASLTVGPTERADISRMTVVACIDPAAAPRVTANLYKLLPVLSVDDVTHRATVTRSLALIKVAAPEAARPRVMDIVRIFRASVVDLAPGSLVIETTGTEDKVEALVEMLRPYGLLEIARTGVVVMTRGSGLETATDSDAAFEPALDAEAPPL
jgi:acetolactate synthase-1/3 small subunit